LKPKPTKWVCFVSSSQHFQYAFSFQKGGDDMRRLMVLNGVVLFLCSVISLSCSTGSERPISQSDIPDLIGKWEGRYDDGGWPELARVQILNDSLEGNISFGFATTPKAFNGKIENGSLVASWEKDLWINMKLRKDGREIKLVGNIQTSQRKATLTLEKIK
jgi:hypothetical protein